jgi:hypothetical protein
MKRLAVIVTLILTGSMGFSQSQADFMEAITGFYPRLEGTEGETQTLAYVESELERLEIPTREHSFREFDEGHSFSRVLEARIEGEREDTIIVAAALNHRLDTPVERDGSVNIAALLELARRLTEDSPELTVRLLFLGADQGGADQHPLGTRLFLQRFFPEGDTAVLYLSGARDRPVELRTGGGGRVSPLWLLQDTRTALEQTGVPHRVSLTQTQIARADLADNAPVIEHYLREGIPGIQLDARSSDGSRSAAGEGLTAVALADAAYRIIGQNAEGIPGHWDTHYLFFSLGDSFLVVTEQQYLLLLLMVVAATLLYGLVFRYRFDRYALTIARNLWNIPLLFLMTFGFAAVGTMLLRYYVELRGFPSLWEHWPFLFFLVKIALSVFLFSLAFQWLSRLPFSKNGSFYSAAAIFLLFFAVIALAATNISFSYYFVWAFFCTFLFSVFPQRWTKAVALLLAPFWLLVAAYEIFTLPALRTAGALLLSPVQGNLVLGLILLPFLLMLIRLDFLIRHPILGRRGVAVKITMVLTGLAVAAALGYLQFERPYDAENPQPITATQRTDMNADASTLILESPAPLGRFVLQYADREFTVRGSDRERRFALEPPAPPWQIRAAQRPFLERTQVSVTVDSERRLSELRARLKAPEELIIFESTFPYTVDAEANEVTFSIGRFPPNPLSIEFTIPRDIRGRLELVGVYPGLAQEAGIRPAEYRLERTHRVEQSVEIGDE